MLSTRRDLIPLDIADELAKLQDQVPPFPYKDVEKIIITSYSMPLGKIFKSFDMIPIASASVAQVHFATLHDGKHVAVKILRPNIKHVIDKDIKLLFLIARLLELIWSDGKRLRPREVVAEFSKHIQCELNLMLDTANCSRLGENFKDKKLLIVPEVYWDFCNEDVMVMERMYGTPISQVEMLRKKKINIKELARNGVEIFFTQVFRDSFFHADMHPGNIQVADDGRYIAMDFGIMGSLSENDKNYLARNFLAFFKRDYHDVALAHIESGWVPKDISIDEFENAIRSVCEPIFNKPLKEISFGRLLIRLFQTSRRFNMEIQPQLTMLQKTLLNIEGLGRNLDPDLDLWKTAAPFLKKYISEQRGIKHILKSLKNEIPHWLHLTPTLPRLIHEFLEQKNLQNKYLITQDGLESFLKSQKNQNRWFKIIISFFGIALLANLIVLFYFYKIN
jgi:ubiquinone biosynthesis protein